MILLKEAKDKKKLQQIKENPYYSERLKRIHEVYEEIKDKPIDIFTKSEYFIFHETGNRLIFEHKYFERRTRLDIYFIMYLLYEREEDLKRLEDIIWAICGEFSWSLPAHVHWENAMDDMVYIDLFASETGQTLGEIMYVLNDKLSDYIKDIIKYEVNRRIIESFENRSYHWEQITNNWAAVCAGCVGMTYIYCAPERYSSVEKRIMSAMDSFLSGYGADGICTEGLGYWNYGFGYYTYFAELLYEFSDGKTDIMHNDKIREISQFQQRMYLNGNVIASFSDGGRYGSFSDGLTHRLKDLFPESVIVPDKKYIQRDFYGLENRFALCVRNLLWSKPEYAETQEVKSDEQYYPEAQWYINKNKNFGFAVKGGNNNESHNHNDIGNFIIASGSEQLIADIGSGEYTKDYFNDAKRYDILCCSSLGHSVPIIDGQVQSAGMEYVGEILKHENNEAVVEIAKAYKCDSLKSAKRTFKISEDKIELYDEFIFDDNKPHDIKERFISLIEPVEEDGCIRIGNMKILSENKFNIIKDLDKDHAGNSINVWEMDYAVQGMNFKIEFKINDNTEV